MIRYVRVSFFLPALMALILTGCACNEWRIVDGFVGRNATGYAACICHGLLKERTNRKEAYKLAEELLEGDDYYRVKYNCPSGFVPVKDTLQIGDEERVRLDKRSAKERVTKERVRLGAGQARSGSG